MAEREQIKRTPNDKSEDVVDETPSPSEATGKLKAELDDLLDEIDEVLETNAEDFVRSFVQKGGQ
jgi:ubiquitin-like protein Pup